MMFICPQCQSRVFTPTGVALKTLDCGTCGTTIDGSQGYDVRAPMASAIVSATGLGKTARGYIIAGVVAVVTYFVLLGLGYFN